MSCEYVCDGCGNRAPADTVNGKHFKPAAWFQRSDADGVQDACCRMCIEKISKATGKTGVVLPI